MEYEHIPISDERLEPIAEMSQGIAGARSVRDVFRSLFLFASRVTPATGIFVTLYTPATGLRRCVYGASAVRDDDGGLVVEEDRDPGAYPQLPLNHSPQSRAILTGAVVNVADFDEAVAGVAARTDTGSDFDDEPPKSSLAVPLGTEGRVLGAFEVQSPRPAAFRDEHVPPLEMAARLAAIAVENLGLLERERAQHEAALRALGIALEYRDFETKGHTDRVVASSLAFGRAVELDPGMMQALRWGAYLHDLGKVAIPDAILLKPGRLTDDEFATIRRHTLIGIDMCRDIPFLPQETRGVVRSHHERWDGGGYPDGTEGDAIPLLARMFSLVDVYDALTSERPYKKAWSRSAAMSEIARQRGRQFDPELVDVFLALVQQEKVADPAE